MDLVFSREECLNLEKSLACEWLETNGLGGFASSSILDCHTRKYHGLLVATLPELNDKCVLLSKVETSIVVQDRIFHLSTNKYPGVFHPTGHKYIDKAEFLLFPKIHYRIGDINLTRSLMMIQGENTVVIHFELSKHSKSIKLRLSPFLAYRSMHALTGENMYLRVRTYVHDGYYKMDPYQGMPPLFFDTSSTTTFFPGPYWAKNVEYLKERSRGFDYQEDLFCPGVMERELNPGKSLFLRVSLDPPKKGIQKIWDQELKRRKTEIVSFRDQEIGMRVIKTRAKQFLIQNSHHHHSIVAGYPWFGEWGRDAMIALPGLTLECGRDELCFEVLKTFSALEKNGLIPNFLSLNGDHHAYNSVDASLWFFWAVQSFFVKTKQVKKIKAHLFSTMQNILRAFSSNTVPHVTLKDNGLLWVGDENTQLTWMDAKVHGKPVTPRFGYAVEINALWYNALCFYQEFCQKIRVPCEERYVSIIDSLKETFVQTFWLEDEKYLADVVNEYGVDAALRPNQIFAASLTHSPLNAFQKHHVVTRVKQELATPFGLRTLSPADPNYCPEYHGSVEKRDAAYHQGTVWPWLVGHFVEASLKVSRDPEATQRRLKLFFSPLWGEHLRSACVGGISEIFNAISPHLPKGCFHQAWSVAEVIRAFGMLNRKGTS